MALQLTDRQIVRRLVVGRNQVGHGLGLRQVHLSVEVSTHGVFARLGLSASAGYEGLDDVLRDVLAAMATNLHHVVARVGMGGAPQRHHHIVDGLASAGGIGEGVEGAIMQGVGLALGEALARGRLEDTVGVSDSVGAAHSNNRKCATRPSGDGADRVVDECIQCWICECVKCGRAHV